MLQGHTAPIDTLQISETGGRLLSFDSSRKDTEIKIWSLDTGTTRNLYEHTLTLFFRRMLEIIYSGRRIIVL